MTDEDLRRVGLRLRELRTAAGMTQSELAGARFSHAYVSVLEAGRREASREARDYFAERLGVSVEQIWSDKGATWALAMAGDLRARGRSDDGRQLLERTLANLERDRELHPRVLVALHLELGKIDSADDSAAAEVHFRRCIELASEEEALAVPRAEAQLRLAEIDHSRGDVDGALRGYKNAAETLLRRSARGALT
jgi:transcriptional regulator with XRE-family HTH domain